MSYIFQFYHTFFSSIYSAIWNAGCFDKKLGAFLPPSRCHFAALQYQNSTLWLPKSHSCFTESFNKIKLEELFYQHVYLWWYPRIFLSRWENKFWPANYFVFVGKKMESAEGALPFSHERNRNTNAVWPYSLLTLYWINEYVIMIVFKSLWTPTETGVGFIWVTIGRRWWAQTELKSSCFLRSMVRMNGRIQTTVTRACSQTFTFCFYQLGLWFAVMLLAGRPVWC